MKCPKCGIVIDIALEMKLWTEEYASQVTQGEPAMLNCVCDACHNGGVWLEMIPYTETESVHSPATGDDIKVPVLPKASVSIDESKENGKNKS